MKSTNNTLFTITLGGWYQRTTLHLSEIYDLLALGRSKLNLSGTRLAKLHHDLDLISVSRESAYLEYVKAETNDGIEIRYYEDGLYILEIKSKDIKLAQKKLINFYERFFNPAISYIFSLGAPTPKVLADIKTEHPIVISTSVTKGKSFDIDESEYGEIYGQIKSDCFSVSKTPEYIFVVNQGNTNNRDLIEMQIFFREFKDQLEKYLMIHRNIWEEISEIKEQRFIKGFEVEGVRNKLDNYQKTVNLITSRINQMGSYLNTRASISKKLQIEEQLLTIFQYKFETLADTHAYIKEIWKMTTDYLNTAIQVVVEVRNQATNASIQSLRIITTIGVLSGIIGYMSKDQFPSLTFIGVWYFVFLILITWAVNHFIGYVYKNIKYELKFSR